MNASNLDVFRRGFAVVRIGYGQKCWRLYVSQGSVASRCFKNGLWVDVLWTGDDPEPDVRDGGDVAGGAADGDRSGAVQDHEGCRVAADGLRAVLGEERQRDQVNSAANSWGSSQSNLGFVTDHSLMQDRDFICNIIFTNINFDHGFYTMKHIN